MGISVIEIGTNSIKFLAVERQNENTLTTIEKVSRANRLSRNMYKNNEVTEESIEKLLNEIDSLMKLGLSKGCKTVAIISTSVLRDAVNSKDIIARIKDQSGIDAEVISGEREAHLAYMACSGLVEDRKNKRITVVDIGGGSSEVITGTGNDIESKYSLDVGAVRLTEMFVKPGISGDDALKEIKAFVLKKAKEEVKQDFTNTELLCTGGTAKTIAKIKLDMDYKEEASFNGCVVEKDEICSIFDRLAALSQEERKQVRGLNPDRADIILTGIAILIELMDFINVQKFKVSSRGVIEGFAEDYLA